MKKVFLTLAVIMLVNLSTWAQKPEKIKIEGYYSNIPKQTLDISGYSFEHKKGLSSTFDAKKREELALTLDGFDQGDDIRIVFTSSEPVVTAKIVEETYMVEQVSKTKYIAKLEARANTKVLFVNQQNEVINYIDVEPSYRWIDEKSFDKHSRQDALAELKELDTEAKRKTCKDKYVRQAIKAAQTQLNQQYGKGVFNEKFRVYTIKSKKFDYSDFNAATQAFITAFSSADVSSEANVKVINNAIEVWKSYELQYVEGKKTKVCDANIDEIYMNLAVAYLTLGDGENIQAYWDKCIAFKGNMTAETYYGRVATRLIDNYDYWLTMGQKPLVPIKPSDLITETMQFNNLVFLQGIFSTYLSSKTNMLYMEELFAPNSLFLGSAEKISKYKSDDLTEKLVFNYHSFGQIDNIKLSVMFGDGTDASLFEEYGMVYKDSTLTYNFVYDGDGRLDRVLLNAKKTLFQLKYGEDGLVSDVSYYGMYKREVAYDINKADEQGNIEIDLSLINPSSTAPIEPEKAKIKLTNNQFLRNVQLAPYTSQKVMRVMVEGKSMLKTVRVNRLGTLGIEHDKYGNMSRYIYYDWADNRQEVILDTVVDEHGNATSVSGLNKDITTKYMYIY